MFIDESPAEIIGNRYLLYERLGTGGMGTVFRALDRLTGRSVALKRVLLPSAEGSSDDPSHDVRLSIAREFRTLATLRHPHIVAVSDYGFDAERQPYFTMDLLANARSFTEAGEAREQSGKVRLLVDLLGAVAYIHRRGLVHRDLKPANVLVNPEGHVSLLDFGLALEQRPTTEPDGDSGAAGTIAYMAPEVLVEGKASVASDLYAVGIMAYELFVGRHPFNKQDIGTLINDILQRVPETRALNAALAQVLDRLLMKKPAARFPDAESVIADLCTAAGEPLPTENIEVRESFLQASTFVGRQAELEQLVTGLNTMLESGTGGAWLIGGESGVGKSRLVEELRIQAQIRGVLILRGQGVAEGGMPLQLWRDAARRLTLSTTLTPLEASILKTVVPDISDLLQLPVLDAPELNAETAALRLSLALVDLLKRQTEPVLLILEDLQWVSESLEPLRLALSAISHYSWMIVGTYRDDDAPDLPARLPEMRGMRLGRLTDDAIRELSAAMLGEAGRQPQVLELIKRETEGNTFFMVEVVRALAEEAGALHAVAAATLPRTVTSGGVQRLLRRRLRRVPDWAYPALQRAAIAGRQIDLLVLKATDAAFDWDAWLTACANAAVLEIMEGDWRFSHDKLRETVLNDLDDHEIPGLHRSIAQAMERVYPGDDSRAMLLVDHWGMAGEKLKEARYAALAAEQLQKVSSFKEALTLTRRGLAVLPADAAHQLRVRLLLLAGDAAYHLSDYSQAIELYQGGLEFSRQNGDHVAEAAALRGLGMCSYGKGQIPEAKDYAEQSLAISRDIEDLSGVGTSLNSLGNVADIQGHYAAARMYYEESLAIRRQIGDRQGVAYSLHNLGGLVQDQGDYALAQAYLEESLAIKTEIGDRHGVAHSLINIGRNAHLQKDYATARDYYEQGLALYRDIGDRGGTVISAVNLGDAAREQGENDRAADYYQQSLELSRTIDYAEGIAASLDGLGQVASNQEDYAAAQAYLTESLALWREIGDPRYVAPALSHLGFVAYQRKQFEQAQAYYQECLSVRQEIDDHSEMDSLTAHLSWSLLALGDVSTAQKYLRDALMHARDQGETPLLTLLAAARFCLLTGDAAQAARLAGFVEAQPALERRDRDRYLQPFLDDVARQLPAGLVDFLDAGAASSLEGVVSELMDRLTGTEAG